MHQEQDFMRFPPLYVGPVLGQQGVFHCDTPWQILAQAQRTRWWKEKVRQLGMLGRIVNEILTGYIIHGLCVCMHIIAYYIYKYIYIYTYTRVYTNNMYICVYIYM